MKHFVGRLLLMALLGAASVSAAAGTVKMWKWTDADGNVVYSQSPPPSGTKGEEKHLDPNRNVIEMPFPSASPATSAVSKGASGTRPPAPSATNERNPLSGGAAESDTPPPPPVKQPPISAPAAPVASTAPAAVPPPPMPPPPPPPPPPPSPGF